MEMRYKGKIAILMAITLLVICGCDKTDISDFGDGSQSGETIECGVSFSVASMDMGTEGSSDDLDTRAIATYESSVTNLWVVQFNVDDNVIGVEYIADAVAISAVSLVPTSKKSTVYYIANTFDPNLSIFEGMSLTEVKALGRSLSSVDDVLKQDSEGNKYLLMSGLYEYSDGTANETGQPTVVLSRNVAKINLSLIVDVNLGLTITSVKVCDIPQNLNYINSSEDIYPNEDDFSTIDYDVSDWGNTTFYLPENKRGEVSEVTVDGDKAKYAPIGATYIEVSANYDENGITVSRIYKFYLGKNFKEDYNIIHNTIYSYKIEFSSVGDPEADSRIEDYSSVVDFTDENSSNCYILNPNIAAERIFYIPIADRINTFWGNYGYENVPENMVEENTELVCEIIWGDNYTSTGSGFNKINVEQDFYDNKNAMKVTIDSSIPYGNIVVGVRREGSTDYLWSWHLWITDYNPDVERVALADVYRYNVPGGEIHRYKDGTSSTYRKWENDGELVGKFIMDRNIGQIDGDAGYYTTNLFYQYGRKDPFPGYGGGKLTDNSDYTAANYDDYAPNDYATSVKNPKVFYTYFGASYDWFADDNYSTTTYSWNDPNVNYGSASTSCKKSLFDPSPLGWKVVPYGTMNGITTSTSLSTKLGYESANAVSYYIDDKLVERFYSTGLLSQSNGSLSSDARGLFWYSNKISADNARAYKFRPLAYSDYNIAFEITANSYPSWGFAVRCVQEE